MPQLEIKIRYNSSWRNSFLDGTNNPLPGEVYQENRKFLGSGKMLGVRIAGKDAIYPNYKVADITKDTVMGVLNRLIGDQRKLYQSRRDPAYFFGDEAHISFEDDFSTTNEIVYLRNMGGNKDPGASSGSVDINSIILTDPSARSIWSILYLPLPELLNFINDSNKEPILNPSFTFNPFSFKDRESEIKKDKAWKDAIYLKDIELAQQNLTSSFAENVDKNHLSMYLPKSSATTNTYNRMAFYCSAIYTQIDRLISQGHDLTSVLSKQGNLTGVSKNGVNLKDLMDKISSDKKAKIVYGAPYKLEIKNGNKSSTKMLRKADGILTIKINSPSIDSAESLKGMIFNAGVSAIILGKKGVSYIEQINVI